MDFLSTRLAYLKNALLALGVRVWLSRPGRVLGCMVIIMLVSGVASMLTAFYLMTYHGALGSVAGALLLCSGIVLFTIFIEPWLAPTSFKFRERHAFKGKAGGPQAYLTKLDRFVRDAGLPCRVKILEGYCPWLLAYGIERTLAPRQRAEHQAQGLGLGTAQARAGGPARRL